MFFYGKRVFITPNLSFIVKRTIASSIQIHPALLKRAMAMEDEFKSLEKKMSAGGEFNVQDSTNYNKLSSFIEIFQRYLKSESDFKDLQKMVEEEEDESLKKEAELELEETATTELENAINELKLKLLPNHPFAEMPSIMELRSGAGGHESNIFTQDLLDMYVRYCQLHHWKFEIASKTDHSSGSGIVDATLIVNENGSYDRLRHEAGVHRVQRVPVTETKGRVHTSASGVVVLPKIDESNTNSEVRKFAPGELRIDVMRASGSGGQHVNTTESAVRIIHLPTGITVNIQDERSQHKNKERAMTLLRARLAERELKERQEKERAERTGQVSSVDRSDKIRTYNFQQNRVTDHRCNYTVYDLEGCMIGERLDDIIDHVVQAEANERSEELVKEIEGASK